MSCKYLPLLAMVAAGALSAHAQAKIPSVKAVLFPFREAIIATSVDGTLREYAYRPGQKFKAKDVLAKLDDRRFSLEAKRASEQFNFAEVAYEDQKKLYAKDFTSNFELKKREVEMNCLKTALDEAKLNLSFCTITAPFAGKIEEVLTREHETVRQGQPLFRMIDDNQLLAVLNIPVNSLPEFKVGTETVIDLPECRLTAKGKVYEIMPRADHRSGTIQIKVLIDNSEGKYTAGMTGELSHGK